MPFKEMGNTHRPSEEGLVKEEKITSFVLNEICLSDLVNIYIHVRWAEQGQG